MVDHLSSPKLGPQNQNQEKAFSDTIFLLGTLEKVRKQKTGGLSGIFRSPRDLEEVENYSRGCRISLPRMVKLCGKMDGNDSRESALEHWSLSTL